MGFLEDLWGWFTDNAPWLFSGIGVVVLGGLWALWKRWRTGGTETQGERAPGSRRDRAIDIDLSRLRVLVIDDKEFPYLELLQRDGFSASRVADVESLSDIDDYQNDLILLDLHGVGSSVSKRGGFGILQHLSEKCPSQIVVAYSAAKWRVRDQGYFELASAVLDKSADYPEFRTTVEDLLHRLDDPDHYVDSAGVAESVRASLRRLVDEALIAGEESASDADLRGGFSGQERKRARGVIRHAAKTGHRLGGPGGGS